MHRGGRKLRLLEFFEPRSLRKVALAHSSAFMHCLILVLALSMHRYSKCLRFQRVTDGMERYIVNGNPVQMMLIRRLGKEEDAFDGYTAGRRYGTQLANLHLCCAVPGLHQPRGPQLPRLLHR